ncbi:hypothetical protein C9J01_14490 [Photobacterium rosenbergii]|uniref:T6SS Phospholipase effector Tle1-like catalytic domain-containing protein n=1 Tax=Photobacterium rosenbergii TaxID=294936 RepID=A0A2T3NDV4_9GAMM|nr:DUF2235 domain-containing protein [Photobacterium rosenbergii]PSW12373.1 hypothetical protein C9J01_14490 [Photobacterium rosenbergii]
MANLIICADGTWNKPEKDIKKEYPTNVLKLARAISPLDENIKQHVFYDWGIGSYYNNMIAGITGSGIQKNIMDCYRYIVQNYKDGDRIYLFGFSRGAYTVRALSGLINNCGILRREHANLVTEAFGLYKNEHKDKHPDGIIAKDFRDKYSHKKRDVHFIGVWDTVGSLGIPFSLMGLFDSDDEFYDTKMGNNISIARHALAIDEKRIDFTPTIWQQKNKIDIKQVWFSGVHRDVGGSYPPDKLGYMASDAPLEWMLREAESAGLILESHIRDNLKFNVKAKLHKSRKHVYRVKKKLDRELFTDDVDLRIHISVKERYLNDSSYRPSKLKDMVDIVGWDKISIEY